MSTENNERFYIDCDGPFIRAEVPLQRTVVTAIVLQTLFTIILVMVTFLKRLLSSFIWDRVNKVCFSKFLMGCYDLKPSTSLLIFFCVILCNIFFFACFPLWCLWITWMRRQDVLVLLFLFFFFFLICYQWIGKSSNFICASFYLISSIAIWDSCLNL